MSKTKKGILIAGGIIISMIILVILFISPLAKFLIEKYDVDYTGREIRMDWAYVNPFTGYIHLDNLVIFEHKSDVVFLQAEGLSANFSLLKLFSSTYEISSIKLNKPLGYVVQHETDFNFSDIITKFSADSTKVKSEKEVRFNLLNIEITDGEIHYSEETTPINYYIKNLNIDSDGLRYNVDTLPLHFSFSAGIGKGDIAGDLTINLENLNYRLAVNVDSFDLEVINQYMKDLTNYGTFAAMLDADIHSTGNFKSADSLSARGKIAVTNFHFGKNVNEDFASFEQLVIDIVQLSPTALVYHFDSISITKPYIKYEKYDYLDNIQTMFGAGGENVSAVNANPNKFNLVIEIAKLIEQLSKNLLRSHYKIGRLAIYDGDIQYSDYSLADAFYINFNPFSVLADSVDKEKASIQVSVKSGIKPHGDFWLELKVNPQDSTFFDLDYRFHKIPLTMFNPYIKTYTSFPLDRGALEFVGKWNVRDGNINSDNHLIIIDPRISKRVRNKDTNWIPVPLAMAIIRDRGNVIDYEIPVSGNLKDPKFNFWDVITDVLKNIFIKPVTTPYRMEVRNVEQKLEKSLSLKWEMQESELSSSQEKFIKKIVEFLESTPDAQIIITPQQYQKKEEEFILMFEAKKHYFQAKNKLGNTALTEDNIASIQKMSIKDEGFVAYLNSQANDSMLFTVQHKAARIIPKALIDKNFEQLIQARQNKFLSFFKDEKIINKVKFLKSKNTIPFNGFSFYEINYKGDFPEFLREAYDKMNELDRQAPRKEYQKKREKVRKAE